MYRLSINLTDSEKKRLNEAVKDSGLNISSYVKKRVFESASSPVNGDILRVLSEISTNINKFKAYGDRDNFYVVERGVNRLWQILS